MKRMRMGLAVLAGLAPGALVVGPAQGQAGVTVPVQECRGGAVPKGDLGISGLDCRGDCSLTLNQSGQEVSWSFSVEPRVTGVTGGGPADGILRPGDDLVAIDEMLITTAAGGRRYANIEPGETVRIRYRRNGRMAEEVIQAGSTCSGLAIQGAPDAPAPVLAGRLARPPRPGEPPGAAAVGVAPRVLTTRGVAAVDPVRGGALGVEVSGAPTLATVFSGGWLASVPKGRLGIGFRCSECGTTTDPDTGESIWFFTGPIEVTGVTEGGPADEAGIQIGDQIKGIGGHALETDAGGRAFSGLSAGEPARLTVVKRNGREVEVRVVPEDEPPLLGSAVAAGPVPEAPAARAAPVARPQPRSLGHAVPPPVGLRAAPDAPDAPEPPAGLPLRYSGTLAGVEVEVRGRPVTVSELGGARTILINADGLWIRIRIPPGGGDLPGEAAGR